MKASGNVKKRERMGWFAVAGATLLLTVVLAIMGVFDPLIYRPVDMGDYWVTIPAGKFLMGSSDKDIEYAKPLCSNCDFLNEQPQHWVDLPEYEIGKYEVTNRQYAQCVKAGVCAGSAYDDSKALHPVLNVNWYDAVTYCEWVGGRLPTEAEWEKAASWDVENKTKYIYPWGDNDPSSDLLNYNSNVGNTTPMGTYPIGENDLYDMAGNVWEWTSSLYADYPYDANDGREDMDSSDYRVLRGGSWSYFVNNVRSAYRGWGYPSVANDSLGFRCARSQ